MIHVFINDLFLFIEKSEIRNFTDNNTLFSFGQNISDIMRNLWEIMVQN